MASTTLVGRSPRIHLVATALALGVCLLAAAPASAGTAGDKALRGLANVLTFPMALPGEIYTEWTTRGAAMGLTAGFAKGLGMLVARPLVGVFELVTSPAPWPRADFEPILEPRYSWTYFQLQPVGAR